jgi:hypothetical protein
LWRLEGEARGHSVAETLAYAAWAADYADEQAALRAAPAGVISPDLEPRIVGRLRRLFGH